MAACFVWKDERDKSARRGDSAYLPLPLHRHYQVQLIKPFAEELHVFVVSVCVATAVQPAGGPAIAVNVTVTFCDGVKPCAEPLPEKYAPALSAA